MNQEFLRHLDAIARDRNVDKEALFLDIEKAMVAAARKHFNAEDVDEFRCEVDRLTGAIHIFRGEQEIPLSTLGRIPAQTAKQVMIQSFREDERAAIFEEFSSRIGDIVAGTAQRYEGGALVVSLGRAEGFMPRSEQIPGEQHVAGERVRCLILDVRDTGSQVKIVLSRSHPEFIRRLFELEVPEVQERIIEIKAMAREPGHRTKVAVSSIDSKVDAVGACVGVRGSRIKNIVDELGGEKIDVVRWNESSQVLIQNALRPAEIVETSLCFELGRATVVVNEDQLSLAIGKRGQNVRLAARLTQWDVDILTPPEFSRGLDVMEETLKKVEGVKEEMIDRLAALGIISVGDVEDVGAEVLMEHLADLGMTPQIAEKCVAAAALRAKQFAEELERERELAERRAAAAAKGLAVDSSAESQADAILGGLGGPRPAAEAPVVAPVDLPESGDLVEALKATHAKRRSPAEASETAADEPRDLALAKQQTEEEAELAADETAQDEAEAGQ